MDSGIRVSPAGTPESQAAEAGSSGLSLYVHIPFCETKCHYCDFNTYAKIESLIPSYIEALNREIVLWGEFFGEHRPLAKTISRSTAMR